MKNIKMERKTTSIKINPEIWNKFKILAINKKVDMSEYLERLIEKELKKNIKMAKKKTTAKRKTRGKTKRYSINYSRVFGKKKKKK